MTIGGEPGDIIGLPVEPGGEIGQGDGRGRGLRGANADRQGRSRREEGLGLPLPAGAVVLFDGPRERPILIGQGSIRDRAVGEDVEILVGEATGVLVAVAFDDETDEAGDHYVLTVSNDRAAPVRFEAEFEVDEEEAFTPRQRLRRRNGMPLWSVTVPANGRASMRYRVDDRPERPDSPDTAEN
jgi:hypothetical protein